MLGLTALNWRAVSGTKESRLLRPWDRTNHAVKVPSQARLEINVMDVGASASAARSRIHPSRGPLLPLCPAGSRWLTLDGKRFHQSRLHLGFPR